MKKLQRLCATALLLLTFTLSVSADDGIIHTGNPAPPPPPPPVSNRATSDEAPTAATDDDAITIEVVTEIAMNFLREALTLF